jgi:hypothetical protein
LFFYFNFFWVVFFFFSFFHFIFFSIFFFLFPCIFCCCRTSSDSVPYVPHPSLPSQSLPQSLPQPQTAYFLPEPIIHRQLQGFTKREKCCPDPNGSCPFRGKERRDKCIEVPLLVNRDFAACFAIATAFAMWMVGFTEPEQMRSPATVTPQCAGREHNAVVLPSVPQARAGASNESAGRVDPACSRTPCVGHDGPETALPADHSPPHTGSAG